MMLYFDRDGAPVDMLRWAELHDDETYKRVGLDVYPPIDLLVFDDELKHVALDLVTISTVWIGINHSFYPDAPPLIFETMIFGGEHDSSLTRYSSEAAALEGHQRTVDDFKHDRVPWFVCDERELSE